MPARDGVRLPDDESGSPATPQFGKLDPEDAVSLAESQVLLEQRCAVSEEELEEWPG
jgi:hypothetical protein